jgi:hypothetical protein
MVVRLLIVRMRTILINMVQQADHHTILKLYGILTLSNAQGKGLCEANAGYAILEMVCWWRDGRGIPSIDKIGGVTQALLVEKGASNL